MDEGIPECTIRKEHHEKKKHMISKVLPGSIGEELELEPGDVLAEINRSAGGGCF